MSARRIGFAFAAVIAACGGSIGTAGAEPCPKRPAFFANALEGAPAHIISAHTVDKARTSYGGWCGVKPQDMAIDSNGGYVYFGVNNRVDSPGREQFYIYKIFRHSAETIADPMLTLGRNEYRPNGDCVDEADDDLIKLHGKRAIPDFLEIASGRPLPTMPGLETYRRWSGGATPLPFASEAAFLASVPVGIERNDIENWSLDVRTTSYMTYVRGDRVHCFPIFRITPGGQDKVIVQYYSGGVTWTYRITS